MSRDGKPPPYPKVTPSLLPRSQATVNGDSHRRKKVIYIYLLVPTDPQLTTQLKPIYSITKISSLLSLFDSKLSHSTHHTLNHLHALFPLNHRPPATHPLHQHNASSMQLSPLPRATSQSTITSDPEVIDQVSSSQSNKHPFHTRNQ